MPTSATDSTALPRRAKAGPEITGDTARTPGNPSSTAITCCQLLMERRRCARRVSSTSRVVPAGSGWTSDPFTLTRKDGRLIGRGVLDDKGPAISSLYALRAIKEAGIPLKRRVRIFLGCDEERGWACVNRYKQTEPNPTLAFTPDGSYPVINSEKNIGQTTYTKKLSGSEVRIS